MSEIILPSVAQLPERILRNVPSRNDLIDARDEVVDAAVELWRKLNATHISNESLEFENGHIWIGLA